MSGRAIKVLTRDWEFLSDKGDANSQQVPFAERHCFCGQNREELSVLLDSHLCIIVALESRSNMQP